MAYQTGSAANITELLNVIRLFAVAQGWTVAKWTPATPLLFLSKGQCFATMQATTSSFNNYETGSAVADSESILRMAVGTSINPALNTYFGHPGAIVTTATDADRVEINDLTGPFPSYHLFSDSSVSDYVHVVVQSAAERWQHFSFGNLDKGSLTHSGVGYVTGQGRYWYRNASTANPANNSLYYNQVDRTAAAFAGFSNGYFPASGTASRQIYVPDALPNTAAWPTITNSLLSHLYLGGLNSSVNFPRANSNPGLLNAVMANPVSQWSGQVMLWAIPCIVDSTASSQLCYVGDFPNVRLVNMEGLTPQQEITLGEDVWKIFPVGRQTSWGTQSQLGFQFSTGQFAFAYKKVT